MTTPDAKHGDTKIAASNIGDHWRILRYETPMTPDGKRSRNGHWYGIFHGTEQQCRDHLKTITCTDTSDDTR